MREKFNWFLVILALILAYALGKDNQGAQVDRYKIVETPNSGTYLLDTATGNSWRNITELSKDKKELSSIYWSNTDKFDNGPDEAAYLEALRTADEIEKAPEKADVADD